jgi:UDP-N-acetylmuramoylalanine--D-glutamate ligase
MIDSLAILGYGHEGRAAFRYFANRARHIAIWDALPQQDLPLRVQALTGPDQLAALEGFDLVIRSPGIDIRRLGTGRELSSVTKYFLNRCPAPVIGVTGTGSDVAGELISAMLRAAGHMVWFSGNRSTPLSFLDHVQEGDLVVLGLSSFQLVDLTRSPAIAVVLRLAGPDLKYHRDFGEYLSSKANICRHQGGRDVVVHHADDEHSRAVAELSPGRRLASPHPRSAHVREGMLCFDSQPIMPLSELSGSDPHLVTAAVSAAWSAGVSPSVACAALRRFLS